ncbi:MAG: hypothetical protein ACJAVV_001202 [Alphaproteobacteria bacterium]|jgi:hypothetical protein
MNDITNDTDKSSDSINNNDAMNALSKGVAEQANDATLSMVHSFSLDVEFDTGISQHASANFFDEQVLLQAFELVLGASHISANLKKNGHYRKGWRSGGGSAPHSVIGSSCLGASIVGGIANNSGGTLVKRGPAYTELYVFAKIDEHGKLY